MLSHNLLLTGDDGYNLTKSLRFRSSASAYLNRTPASAGNRRTWTYSTWIKRGTVGAEGTLISGGATTGRLCVFFNSSGQLVSDIGGTGTYDQSTAVYRDPSAWYHFVWQFDTTQATAANRSRMYINGVQVSLTNTRTFTQNADYEINNSVLQTLGTFSNSIGTYNFDGYQTEVNFIDGQALTPSSFGSTNALTGVWQPAKYTGTYGTNGFYLPFTNTTSTSTLGNDFSGNSNTWTVNNISLTTGSTYDSMTDVPTLTSATAANYCTMNPLFAPIGGANFQALSNANLTISGTSASNSGGSIGTMSNTTGKFYYEFTMTSISSGYCCVGSSDVDQLAGLTPFNYLGYGSKSYGYFSSGSKTNNNGTSAYGATYTTGDIISVAVDCTNGAIYFAKNGTWQASGDPTSGASKTGAAYTWTGASQNMIPQMDVYTTGAVMSFNCGQRAFSYTPPTGFVALNTFNLPTSTIVNGGKCMDATIYTGDGSQTASFVNTFGFKPDLVWSKIRSGTTQGIGVFDSVRGTTGQSLDTASTSAEGTWNGALSSEYGYVSAFNSNGFSVNDGSVSTVGGYVNYSGRTYVGWQWQAGQGSTSSNTSGSITSTVSVNATAGFSVVTYTGTGSNATVGHGLGVAPSMIIVKRRDAGASGWSVYFTTLPAGYVLSLQSTAAQANSSGRFTTTLPTSTVFSIGTDSDLNASAGTYVAYCWTPIAGYSAFGSYTGNGSADGPFVYTGFRPRFIMIKCSSSTGDWVIFDTSRNLYNSSGKALWANLSDVEGTYTDFDILSNGFKLRFTSTTGNGSGATYIYAAFAESPFRNSLAR